MDVYGVALQEYYSGKGKEKLWLQTNYGELEEMPLDIFFRGQNEMPDLELYALELCYGKILDIGAGVGSHSLILQNLGFDVTALEISSILCEIMKQRSIENILNEDIFSFTSQKFDTLLLLMNGIGLTGNLDGFRDFLQHAKQLIKPSGQLIFDSSDIGYLYEEIPKPENKYFGEISYRYQYKEMLGEWFKWLYIDQDKLLEEAAKLGWMPQIIYENEDDHYLTRLILL